MRPSLLSVALIFGARQVVGHAIFQEFWIDGVDQISDLLIQNCFVTDFPFTAQPVLVSLLQTVR